MCDQDAIPNGAGAEFGVALDELLQAWSSGCELTRAELLARHPDLGADADRVLELAHEIAVMRPPRQPSIPGYDLLGEAGRGGMGVVYRARQHGVDRVIALKVLPEALGADARSRARFLAEVRGLGRIRHDHVVTIHGVVEAADFVAYAMEWVDGRSLASLLEELASWPRRGPMPVVHFGGEGSARLPAPAVPWFCRIGVAMARALAEVHRHGLVHRDVKPSNVLLRADGTPLLADFGLVRAENVGLTRTGQVVGTPAFAAPEQLRANADVGPAADVFALGATLHCALVGQAPFAGRTPLALLANIESRRRRSLVTLGLPRDLETIVAKCVEPEVKDRYESADEVADDLENLLALRPVRARPLGILARAVRLVRRNRRMVVAIVLSALVVLTASVAVGAWLWSLATLPERFGRRLQGARFALLEPTHEERVELAKEGRGPQRPSAFETFGQQALEAYAAALELDDGREDVAAERDVVAMAQAMLQKRAPVPGKSLSVATLTCAAARAWHEGRDVPLAEIEAASGEDRRALGLLAFLTGRANECHAAWSRLEMSGDTFIDAAAGQMHLQRGDFTRAAMRLARAAQTWPDAGFLAVALADCAVRGGDHAFAESELDRAERLDRKDPFSTHKRVRADLRAAQGRTGEARELYEWLLAHHRGKTARKHYAVLLERIGDRGRLVDVMLDLVEMGSHEDRCALAIAAARWWGERPWVSRVAEFDRFLQGFEPPGKLQRLTKAARVGGLAVGPERGTLEETASSSVLQEAIGGLDQLMEITQMEHFRPDSLRDQVRLIRHLTAMALATATSVGPARRGLRAWLVDSLVGTGRALAALGVVVFTSLGSAQTVQWTNATTATSPPARRQHVTAIDPLTRDVLIYGGYQDGSPTPQLTDFWRWNGTTWSQILGASQPGASTGIAVNVSSLNIVLMVKPTATGLEAWSWNGSGWSLLTPATGNPAPRADYALAYDVGRDRVVLHGGADLAAPYNPRNDTWEWDPTSMTWSFVATGPTRYGHAMAYDPVQNRTVLQGGNPTLGPTHSPETWTWNGTTWSQVASLNHPLWVQAMAWDENKQRLVMFGGSNPLLSPATAMLNEVHEWNGTSWLHSTVTSAAQPTGRGYVAIAFHPTTQTMVSFGGWFINGTVSGETWTYTPAGPPRVDVTGPGCNPAAGLTPVLSRRVGTGPWIGTTLEVDANQLPPVFPSFPFMVLGLTDPAAPLGILGAPSCTLRADLVLLTGISGNPAGQVSIPNDTALYGRQLFAQTLSLNFFQPFGAPGFITAMSNGLRFTVGSR